MTLDVACIVERAEFMRSVDRERQRACEHIGRAQTERRERIRLPISLAHPLFVAGLRIHKDPPERFPLGAQSDRVVGHRRDRRHAARRCLDFAVNAAFAAQ